MVEVKVSFYNNNTSGRCNVGLFCAYNQTTDALITETIETLLAVAKSQRWATWSHIMCSGNADQAKATLTMRIPIAKMLGLPNYRTDTTYYGGVVGTPGTSPTNIAPLVVWIANPDTTAAGADYTVDYDFQANIYCTMWLKDYEYH